MSEKNYSAKQLKQDIDRVRKVYETLGRHRLAIHEYWLAVYRLRRKWRRLRRQHGVKIRQLARKTFATGVSTGSGDALLKLILDRTMVASGQSPAANKALSKLKSKYFSLLDYAYSQNVSARDLLDFIKAKGGLNFKTKLRPPV